MRAGACVNHKQVFVDGDDARVFGMPNGFLGVVDTEGIEQHFEGV